MNSLATMEFANAVIADAERHWLYGHPYRTERGARSYATVRSVTRPRRRLVFAGRRHAGALAARRGLAA
jgi:hypothetical protein